jgi:hypothetical protein
MMKRIRFGFLVLAAAFVQHAFADAGQATAAIQTADENQSEACIINKADPYDVGEMMHAGAFKGQCMDITTIRPAVILSEDDSKITIANFYHEKSFWIAEIPKSGVDQVIFQIAQFPQAVPLLHVAHNQLRFMMKPGVMIKLTPQETDSKLAPTELNQLNLVDQPSGPKDLNVFNPKHSFSPTYGNVLRVAATQDRAKEELGGNDDTTRQFLLDMTDDEKTAALVNGVHLSAKLGYDDIYKLFSENCMTTAFQILDESVDYGHKVHRFKMDRLNIFDPVTGPSIHALKKRGLIEKELETWNEETGLR